MKKYLIIILLAVIGIGFYAITEYNRGPRDLSEEAADISLSATILLSEFETDETAANKAYLDKVIQVSGTILELNKEGANSLSLDAGNPMSSVICELGENEIFGGVKIGDKVSVKGQCTGYLMDVVLVKSVIIK